MKVFPLHIGDSKVPYGQFYGGVGDEWVGMKGVVHFLTDKSHYMLAPIYAYLIDHPQAGLVLVDTGINWEMAHSHNKYYDHWLFHLTLDEDEYQLTHEQELSSHMKRLGYRLEDVRTVIITHLHEDHLGELRSVPQAKVILSQAAWDAKNLGIWSFREWSPSVKGVVKDPELITYTSGTFYSFDQSQDVFGDGSVRLLPTPGHADGHSCVFVQMGDYQFLITGDALYTLRHLALDEARAILMGNKMKQEYLDSIRRIQELRKALPDLVILTQHDHTAYQFKYVEPFLADGVLSVEERQAIKDYEAHLFGNSWHLVPAAMPHYIQGRNAAHVGTVTE